MHRLGGRDISRPYSAHRLKSISDRQARLLAWGLIIVTALLSGSTAMWRMLSRVEPHVEVNRDLYPVRGIDLSAHNGVPDFDSIAAAGIHFVYLKASEGSTFRDRAFLRNYLAARRAGLMVGAYHFFRFDCDGTSQASNFLRAVVGCEFQLPPAIDVEEWGNPAGYSTAIISERLRSMTALITARRGKCILYTNKDGAARFMESAFADTAFIPELWICSFTDPPLRGEWRLWQHSHKGKVPGVKGRVDLNTFNGSLEEWRQWCKKS